MSNPFAWFLIFCAVVWGPIIFLARGVIAELSKQAAAHARLNARAYAIGTAYVSAAVLTDTIEVFSSLSSDVAEVLPWWSWLVLFAKPVLGGLITLGAYLANGGFNKTPQPKP